MARPVLLHPDFPFRPARIPVFYGWVVLVVSIVGVVMSLPGQTHGVGVFTDPLLAATGLERVEFSICYMLGTICSGFCMPYGGRLIDRWGCRLVVVVAAVWLGCTLFYLAFSDRLALRLSASTPIDARWSALVVLTVGFVSLRFSGQGMLTLVSRTMLGKWFDRRRGLASSWMSLFVAFGFSSAPLGLHLLVEAGSWRSAWLLLGLVVCIGMSLLGWAFYRDNPEECGLRMDGDALVPVELGASGEEQRVEGPQFTRAEALRCSAFWAVTLTFCVHALIMTGLAFHIVAIGREAGLDKASALTLFLPLGVIGVSTAFIVGILSDRVAVRWLLLAMAVCMAVGMAAMPGLDSPWGRSLVLLGLGMSGGFFGPLSTVALPRYFGRRHLGAIGGATVAGQVIASALGPAVLALGERLSGSFMPAFLACLVLPLGASLLALSMREPRASLSDAPGG